MTIETEALARIDAAHEAVAEARNHVAHFPLTDGDAVRVTRLADIIESLIPEPPTDDERDDEADAILSILLEHGLGTARGYGQPVAQEVTDAIMAAAPWRNRGRGPITDEGWEYGVIGPTGRIVNNGDYRTQQTHRRRAPGPWEEIEAARDAEAGQREG